METVRFAIATLLAVCWVSTMFVNVKTAWWRRLGKPTGSYIGLGGLFFGAPAIVALPMFGLFDRLTVAWIPTAVDFLPLLLTIGARQTRDRDQGEGP